MRYRVRLSVIEPPGTNPTSTPVLPAAVHLVSRSDEVVDVRVSITTTEPGQASYEITTPAGAIVEVGFGDEAWARRMAGATRLRRISLIVDTDLSLEQLRAAADSLSAAINQGGRTLVGTSVRLEPASSSSMGIGILALVLLGGAYYAARRGGMLGEWHPEQFLTEDEAVDAAVENARRAGRDPDAAAKRAASRWRAWTFQWTPGARSRGRYLPKRTAR